MKVHFLRNRGGSCSWREEESGQSRYVITSALFGTLLSKSFLILLANPIDSCIDEKIRSLRNGKIMKDACARRIIAPEFQSSVKFVVHSIRQVFIPGYVAKPRDQGFDVCFECLYIWMPPCFLHLLWIVLRICEEIGIEVQQSPALPCVG